MKLLLWIQRYESRRFMVCCLYWGNAWRDGCEQGNKEQSQHQLSWIFSTTFKGENLGFRPPRGHSTSKPAMLFIWLWSITTGIHIVWQLLRVNQFTGDKVISLQLFLLVALFLWLQEQLTKLMTTLHSTAPHFVRCIVPNEFKQSGKCLQHLWTTWRQSKAVPSGLALADWAADLYPVMKEQGSPLHRTPLRPFKVK